jgi:hypothetical protein
VKKDEEEETVEQVVRTGCERARREIRAEEKNLTLILLCIRVRIGLARLPDCLWGAEGGPGARCSGYLCYAARSQQATAFHRGGPIGHEGTFLRPDAPHMHGSTGCSVVSAFYHRTTTGRRWGPRYVTTAGTPPAPARETTRPTPRPPGAGRVTSGMHGTHGN